MIAAALLPLLLAAASPPAARAPDPVAAAMAPVTTGLTRAVLQERIDRLSALHADWYRDWQAGRITAAELRARRTRSELAFLNAMASANDPWTEESANAAIAFYAASTRRALAAVETLGPALDVQESAVGVMSLAMQSADKVPQWSRRVGAIEIVRALQFMIASVPNPAPSSLVLAKAALALTWRSVLAAGADPGTLDELGTAAFEAWTLNEKQGGNLLTESSRNDLSITLGQLAAVSASPNREAWARLSLATSKAEPVNAWQKYTKAVMLELVGEREKARRLLDQIIAEDSPAAWSDFGTGSLAALVGSRHMVQAEAGAMAFAGGDAARGLALLDASLGGTASAAELLALEERITARGEVLVQPVVGLSAGWALVSRRVRGRVDRHVVRTPSSGGLSLMQSYFSAQGGAGLLPGGMIAAYALLRSAKRQGDAPLLNGYVETMFERTEAQIAGTIRAALETAPPGARVVVILPGPLALFPIAGARTVKGASLVERFEVRFALDLAHADRTARAGPGGMSGIAFLSEPDTDLDAVRFEQAALRPTASLAGAPSPAAALSQLAAQPYWHIASHGVWSPTDQAKGGISLGKSAVLSSADILAAKGVKPPRLVFLSACETGLPNLDQPLTRFVSLQTAFAYLGAEGVIGTLWPVADASSSLLAVRFDEHRRRGFAPARALRAAQLWLRDASRADLRAYLAAKVAADRVPADAAGALAETLDGADAAVRPFAHPYYWAGYQLLGG